MTVTKMDRLKDARLLKELAADLEDRGEIKCNHHLTVEIAVGFDLLDKASAVHRALAYMARHVDLETGELTAPLDEPEAGEAA